MAVLSKDTVVIELDVQGQAKVKDMEDKLSSLEKKTDNTKGKFSDMGGSISKVSDSIRQKISQTFPEVGSVLDTVSSNATKVGVGMEAGGAGASVMSRAMGVLKIALSSLGIGLVITAVTSLIGYLKDFDPIMDKIANTVQGAKSAFQELGNRVQTVTSSISLFLKGDFSAGFKKVAEGFRGASDAIGNAYKDGVAFRKLQDEAEDFEHIILARQKERQDQTDRLNLTIRQKKGKERVEALNQIKENARITQVENEELLGKQQKILREQIRLQDQYKVLTSKQLDTLSSGTSKSVELAYGFLNQGSEKGKKIGTEALKFIEEFQQKRVDVNRKANDNLAQALARQEQDRARAEALAEKLRAEAEKKREKQEADKIKAQEFISAERIGALEDELEKGLAILTLNKAKELEVLKKLDISDELRRQAQLSIEKKYLNDRSNITDKYYQETLKKLEERRKEIDALLLSPLSSLGEKAKETQIKSALAQAQKLADEFNKIRAKDAKDLADYEKTKGKIREDAEKQIATNTIALFNNATQARIDNIDAEISAQQNKISRFRELAEFGTTESLQLEEDRLQRLQVAREKEVQKQKQLATIQIAINQAVTISEGVKLAITAFGKGDIITGVLTTLSALSAVAVLTQQISSSFGSLPAFKEGSDYIEGQGTGTSDSIVARVSKGEKIMTASHNSELRGVGIISNADVVRYAKIGRAIGDTKEPKTREGKDYTQNFEELVRENRLMRKKLENLEIHMGISSEGVYGMITSMQERSNRIQKLKD